MIYDVRSVGGGGGDFNDCSTSLFIITFLVKQVFLTEVMDMKVVSGRLIKSFKTLS